MRHISLKNVVCIAIVLAFFQEGFTQKQIVDKVIATVGGELILLSEILEEKNLLSAQQGELPENVECIILDQIIGNKLLVNQAKLDSIEVSDEEVETQLNARVDNILSMMNGSREQFREFYGISVNEMKEQFREDLRHKLLAERMRGSIALGTSVTPSEVVEFFDQIPADSLPYFNSEVEVSEIVMRPKVNDVERKKAYDELSKLKQEIENGAKFDELAQKFSDDFGSARIGGDLGWTKRGSFVPEFEAEAYNMQIGELSEIVESDFGLHLIQVLERRGNQIHTRHILIRPEITDADIDLVLNKLDSVKHLINSDSISFSDGVKRFSDEDIQSYSNNGRISNPISQTTYFEVSELEPDIFFAIDTMKVGELSNPFEYKDQRGDSYYRILKLVSRTSPHKANLSEDYSKIQTAATDQKKNIFVNEWMEDKISATHIEIDETFECEELEKWIKE